MMEQYIQRDLKRALVFMRAMLASGATSTTQLAQPVVTDVHKIEVRGQRSEVSKSREDISFMFCLR